MPLRIEDYALIGDCKTAALVGRDGSIDWLCWPRFDSPACFGALLGTSENGRSLIAPVSASPNVSRRYLADTLILETEFQTETGTATVVDFMPTVGEAHLVRIVFGRSGEVKFRTEFVIRFGYGAIVPWVTRAEDGTINAIAGPERMVVRTPVALYGEDLKTVGEFTVSAGQRVPFILSYGPSFESAAEPIDPFRALETTTEFWRQWTGRCPDVGPWTGAVKRSLITLKALTYAPTGGIVAAVTTALPECLGGSRNWDYRFCWLRDLPLRSWHSCISGTTTKPRYGKTGSFAPSPAARIKCRSCTASEESAGCLNWSSPGSPVMRTRRPYAFGNAAAQQLQIDVFGEVEDAMFQARKAGMKPSKRALATRSAVLEHLAAAWREPDEGIWEVRGGRQHFVHSKVMAWVAFDRAANDEEHAEADLRQQWREIANEIHAEICEHGFDPELNSFVQAYGSKRLDAGLLLLPLVEFLPPDEPRMRGTLRAIEEKLLNRGEFVLRYESEYGIDGLPAGEGAFFACGFWLVDNYVLHGRCDEARSLFERLLSRCNDVGLLAEEFDPLTGRMLGNFPQAYCHVGIINCALNLSRQKGTGRGTLSAKRARSFNGGVALMVGAGTCFTSLIRTVRCTD